MFSPTIPCFFNHLQAICGHSKCPPEESELKQEKGTDTAGCGRTIDLADGEKITIMSPNYPNKYGNNAECEWTVNSPPGTTIQVWPLNSTSNE